MHVLSLPQNKFRRVFFRLFDGALETSNFRFEKARSVITLLRCFLHENTQRGKIARVKFAEELSTMSKNRLRWITLVRGPIWGIHSLTLMISCIIITITITIVDHHHPTLHGQFLCIMVIFKVPVSLQILCAHSVNYRCNRMSWYRP